MNLNSKTTFQCPPYFGNGLKHTVNPFSQNKTKQQFNIRHIPQKPMIIQQNGKMGIPFSNRVPFYNQLPYHNLHYPFPALNNPHYFNYQNCWPQILEQHLRPPLTTRNINKEPIIISDDEEEVQKNITTPIQNHISLKQSEFISIRKEQRQKNEEKTGIVLQKQKLTQKKPQVKNQQKLKLQIIKCNKTHKIQKAEKPQRSSKQPKPQKIKKIPERQSYRQKQIRENEGEIQPKYSKLEQPNKIRVGRQYQCILPTFSMTPSEHILWIQEKRNSLQSRKLY